MTTLDKSLEIRKLKAEHLRPLVEILDSNDSWKTLMAKIPKKLASHGYKCNISVDNLAKYRAQDFSKIDQGSIDYKRSPTEILMDEWGTSGRPRAALGHLFHLLIKAELFRAADYIAKLIGEQPPARPSTGAAARVTFNLPDPETLEAEKQLNAINYIPKAIEEIKKMSDHTSHPSRVIPEIVVSKEESSDDHMSSGLEGLSVSGEIPDISGLLEEEDEEEGPLLISEQDHSDIIPNFDILQSNGISSGSMQTIGDSASFNGEIPLVSELDQYVASYNTDIPLMLKDDVSSCELQTVQSSEISYNSEIPLLMLNKDISSCGLQTIQSSQISYNSEIPLIVPQLLDVLPHFPYEDLERATANFTAEVLGKGGFGTVFLATGLMDKPVAVKKLNLDIGEKVAKQFKNEIEIMHKYKHENLALLLGYSSDVTYCLVYEYVPGGNFREALQNRSLTCQSRLQVALGTARGLEYLHNAFSTPLVHRDVTSANILLDGDQKAKLCDFGIAKLLPEDALTIDTVPCGTTVYMSPEYRLKDVSVYVDTFSFGVVLLELLTSLSPFDADGSGTDLISHMEELCDHSVEPILDKTIGWEDSLADKLYGMVQRCLEEKNKRPDMKTVVSELQILID